METERTLKINSSPRREKKLDTAKEDRDMTHLANNLAANYLTTAEIVQIEEEGKENKTDNVFYKIKIEPIKNNTRDSKKEKCVIF